VLLLLLLLLLLHPPCQHALVLELSAVAAAALTGPSLPSLP
jgi:hypothetical protein